jgi:hypothetical protein
MIHTKVQTSAPILCVDDPKQLIQSEVYIWQMQKSVFSEMFHEGLVRNFESNLKREEDRLNFKSYLQIQTTIICKILVQVSSSIECLAGQSIREAIKLFDQTLSLLCHQNF